MRFRWFLSLSLCLALGNGVASAGYELGMYHAADWCGVWASDAGGQSTLCVTTYTSAYGWGPWPEYASAGHRPFSVSHLVIDPDGTRHKRLDYDPVIVEFAEIPERSVRFRGTIKGCAVELLLVSAASPSAPSPSVNVDASGRSSVGAGGDGSGTTYGTGTVCDDPVVTGLTEGYVASSSATNVAVS